ncbi:MAG: hypothetical protein ACJ788_03795 [Ktedonobacteraceae bacterium]
MDATTRSSFFVRNMMLGSLLELFLVSAVAAILVIRFFLAVTGYPQLGGRGLHIAHMLWGGLLMMLALVLLLAFLGRRIQFIAAVLGGVGFGTFIDELGKFITSNNNYFFQPTIALIYIIFVLMFLGFQALERRTPLSQQERLANALDIIKEGVLHPIHAQDKMEVLSLLRTSGSHDPRFHLLTRIVEDTAVAPPAKPSRLEMIANGMSRLYQRMIHSPQFAKIIIGCFIGYALLFILLMFLLSSGTLPLSHIPTSFVYICLYASLILSGVLIVIGVLSLHRSRMEAYRWFKRSILVSILLVQVFLFYVQALSGLGLLVVNLVILATLNAMIWAEQSELQQATVDASFPK